MSKELIAEFKVTKEGFVTKVEIYSEQAQHNHIILGAKNDIIVGKSLMPLFSKFSGKLYVGSNMQDKEPLGEVSQEPTEALELFFEWAKGRKNVSIEEKRTAYVVKIYGPVADATKEGEAEANAAEVNDYEVVEDKSVLAKPRCVANFHVDKIGRVSKVQIREEYASPNSLVNVAQHYFFVFSVANKRLWVGLNNTSYGSICEHDEDPVETLERFIDWAESRSDVQVSETPEDRYFVEIFGDGVEGDKE